jgi:hypothetical protein
MDPVDATKVVVEEFGRDALRVSPDESDWDTAHNLLKVLVQENKADPIFAAEIVVGIFGRSSIQDIVDLLVADLNVRTRGRTI